MDISPTATATVKTPEAEVETPSRIQPIKPLTFTNGVLKRHHLLNNHHLNPPPPAAVVVTYKECLKNHAATMGGHAVDGCGEFMPSPTATQTDPTSLKCAACGCHRNFHRREPEDPIQLPTTSAAQHVIEYQPHHRHHPPPPPPPPPLRGGNSSPNSPSPPPISSSYYPSAPHMLLALSSGLSGHPTENNPAINSGGGIQSKSNGRKRFRTKFTQDQKSMMYEFAEKIGWKIQKRDEERISDFCSEVGVERTVLKVWMHNNKNTLGKKVENHTINNGIKISTTDQIHHNNDNDNDDDGENLNHHHNHQNSDSLSPRVVATNGSSSSS